jgi:hypothetical protein
MAMEVTARFREMRPDDPVRYDFVLTRFGINPELRHGKADLHKMGERQGGLKSVVSRPLAVWRSGRGRKAESET